MFHPAPIRSIYRSKKKGPLVQVAGSHRRCRMPPDNTSAVAEKGWIVVDRSIAVIMTVQHENVTWISSEYPLRSLKIRRCLEMKSDEI